MTDRYYDPYGNPIGTPATGFPDGEKGFTGGVTDTATGLTNLGAREYQPQTGSFISTDSVLQPYDPQDLNAYTYAADNPTTYSDPTGASATNKCPAGVTCTANGTPIPADYEIYIIYDPNGTPVYVGQTNNYGRRKGEHTHTGKLPKGFRMQTLIGGLTLGQADGIEQITIDTLGMSKDGDGILSNARNEIRPSNPAYNGDMDEAVQILANNPGVVQQIVNGADKSYSTLARGNAYDLQSYTNYIRTQDEYGSWEVADEAVNVLVKEDTSLELNAGSDSVVDVCEVDPELC